MDEDLISRIPPGSHILVATLGGQPQIVCFGLDRLLEVERYPIQTVLALHPATNNLQFQRSLTLLQNEFREEYHPFSTSPVFRCTFYSYPLRYGTALLEDIVDQRSAEATLECMYIVLKTLKERGCHIHLLVSGGRRFMAMYGQYLASLLFTPTDHLWHLHTPEDIQDAAGRGTIMHLPYEAGIRLIAAPFFPLSLMAQTHLAPSAHEQQRLYAGTIARQEHAACSWVYQECSVAEKKVLQAYAEGNTQDQVCEQLCVTIHTVRKHTKKILSLVRIAWEIKEENHLDYHFVYRVFHAFPFPIL
jgi:CRISPR-associated protein Csx14